MAGFWKRRKNNITAPAQYIQTTDTVSRPLAVLMTLAMIFVGIALIFSLFLGIKWGIDKVNSDDSKKQAPISTQTNGASGSATVTPTTPGQISSNNSSTSGQTSSASATKPATTTGTSTTVPNTGPSNVALVFFVGFIISTLSYRALLIRKLSD